VFCEPKYTQDEPCSTLWTSSSPKAEAMAFVPSYFDTLVMIQEGQGSVVGRVDILSSSYASSRRSLLRHTEHEHGLNWTAAGLNWTEAETYNNWTTPLAMACPSGKKILYYYQNASDTPRITCEPCALDHFCKNGQELPCPPFEMAVIGSSACVCTQGFTFVDSQDHCTARTPACPAGYAVTDALRYPMCEPCPHGTTSTPRSATTDGHCHLVPLASLDRATEAVWWCRIIIFASTLNNNNYNSSGSTTTTKNNVTSTNTTTTTTTCHGTGEQLTIDCECGCPVGSEWHFSGGCVPCKNGTRSSSVGRSPCVPFH
jgi:hypothetical protein